MLNGLSHYRYNDSVLKIIGIVKLTMCGELRCISPQVKDFKCLRFFHEDSLFPQFSFLNSVPAHNHNLQFKKNPSMIKNQCRI